MPMDIISRAIATTAYARAGDPNPIRLSSILGGTVLANETTGLANAMAQMNSQRRPLLIDRSINITGWTTLTGYCVISCEGDAKINLNGGTTGFRIRNTYTTLGSWTAAPTLTQWPAGTGSYVTALTVDAATYAGLATGDHVYLSDSVNNTFVFGTTNYTNLAEIAMVVDKSGGNTIYLDRALGEWNLYSASGTVTRIDNNQAILRLNIVGEQTAIREIIRLDGYVRPIVDAVISGNSSRGVTLAGCMGARVRALVDNLRDDEANNAFGYGVCLAAASTDCEVEVNAKRVRHAYSDIIIGTSNGLSQPAIFTGGVVRRTSVTGVAVACTAASWDTHSNSDRVRFENIKAWGTHNPTTGQTNSSLNCALQVRGTNVTVDGLETNLPVGIRYGVVAPRASTLEVSNFRHQNAQVTPVTAANSLFSFVGTTFSGSGTHKVNIRNSMLQNLQYAVDGFNFVSVHHSEIDMSTSTSSWPGNANAGCATEYINCVVRNTNSMNVSTGLTFHGGKISSAYASGFNLLAGAVLEACDHGIEITGGGSVANSAYAYSSITSGATSFKYANLWVDDARAEYSIRPFAYTGAGGTQVMTIKNLVAPGPYKGVASKGDADVTLRPGRDKRIQRFATTLTADRTVTLDLTDVDDGDEFEIFRPAAGAFNLLIKQGATTLCTLTQNGSCRVAYELSASSWRVMNKGVIA